MGPVPTMIGFDILHGLQMRADRKAALEASGLDDDDDEEEDLDDSFYPASLPPWCACASLRHCIYIL